MRFLHPANWPDRITTTVIGHLIVRLMLWLTRAMWNGRPHSGNVFVKGATAVATAGGRGGAVIVRG